MNNRSTKGKIIAFGPKPTFRHAAANSGFEPILWKNNVLLAQK
jgi:hypothetical protein